jgi:hypothetical protein
MIEYSPSVGVILRGRSLRRRREVRGRDQLEENCGEDTEQREGSAHERHHRL